MEGSKSPDTPNMPASVLYTESTILETTISGYFDNFFSNYPVCQLKIMISSTTLEILQIYTHMR